MLGNLISGAMSLFGGYQAQKSQEKMAEQNIQLQKQFAQEGIQWKVADAKAAGIHPLYALGAQTHSFAPVSVGDSLSSAWANAGQDIGRAINATSNGSQRLDAIGRAAQGLALEKAGLENELLRSQIRRNNSAGTPPPSPAGAQWAITGQGATQLPGTEIQYNPHEVTGGDPARPHAELGAIPDLGYSNSAPGYYWPVPSADVKKRIEDNLPAEVAHAIRTIVSPAFGYNMQPPQHIKPRPGEMWRFHPFYGYYIGKDPRYIDAGAGRFSPGRRLRYGER